MTANGLDSIIMMLFLPKGLVSLWDRAVTRLRPGRNAPSSLATPPGAPGVR